MTHTHTHTHTQRHIHTYAHTRIHAYITYIRMRMRIHIPMPTPTPIPIPMPMPMQMPMPMPLPLHLHLQFHLHLHMHMHIHAYTHIYIPYTCIRFHSCISTACRRGWNTQAAKIGEPDGCSGTRVMEHRNHITGRPGNPSMLDKRHMANVLWGSLRWSCSRNWNAVGCSIPLCAGDIYVKHWTSKLVASVTMVTGARPLLCTLAPRSPILSSCSVSDADHRHAFCHRRHQV